MAGAGFVVAASLLWPRVTDKPQPEALRDVRGSVLGTEIGQRVAQGLGVSSDDGQPLNFSDAVSSVTGAVTSSVEQNVGRIISDQVAAQVIKQYEQLPAVQQNRVVEMICKP